MEKVENIIRMEVLNMMEIMSMVKKKEEENIYGKMVISMKVNLKMIYLMEKEQYMMMGKYIIKVILLMGKKKEMEKKFY